MTDVVIEQTASGQIVTIELDADQSDSVANGEVIELVAGEDFHDDGIGDGLPRLRLGGGHVHVKQRRWLRRQTNATASVVLDHDHL